MELQIQGKNLELDGHTRDYIARKLNRLGRHLPDITMATVELERGNSKSQDRRVAVQVTLDIDGTMLRGEQRAPNAMAAVDSVIDVMDRRLERYKSKAYRSEQAKKAGKDASIRPPEVPDAPPVQSTDDEDIVEAEGRVVRIKRFPIKPMTVDEAAFQMELLGHDFFMFLNGETDRHNLSYKRHDGDYGLIQPEPI